MKFIALKDFAKVGPLIEIEIPGQIHDRHIHKGAIFEIGQGDVLKKMDPSAKALIAQLVVTSCIGDATDAKLVKAVNDEIEMDAQRAENHARINAGVGAAQLEAMLKSVLGGIASHAAAAPPAKVPLGKGK